MEKYKVVALSVAAKRGIKESGEIVTQENFSTPVEELVEKGFLEKYSESDDDIIAALEADEKAGLKAEMALFKRSLHAADEKVRLEAESIEKKRQQQDDELAKADEKARDEAKDLKADKKKKD
jgi:hypothetical protein